MRKGIDVSGWNVVSDYAAVAADNVDFAIIKIIRKDLNPDRLFEKHWAGFSAAGVPIPGVYNYSYATTVEKFKSDAQRVIEVLAGRKVKVWLDIEDVTLRGLGIGLINGIRAYAKVIEAAGLEFGIYTYVSFYNSYLKPYEDMLPYSLWIARYPSSQNIDNDIDPDMTKCPEIGREVEGWQYSSKGIVQGINGNVDLNVWYKEEEVKEEVKEELQAEVVSDGKNVIYSYSKSKEGNEKLSKNFKVKEFTCKDGSDVIFIAPELVAILQEIRDHYGKAVHINSAYRTPSYNKKVDGATYSQHLYGTAADIRITGVKPRDIAAYAETLLFDRGGIGIYNNFVHIDVRDEKARWNG